MVRSLDQARREKGIRAIRSLLIKGNRRGEAPVHLPAGSRSVAALLQWFVVGVGLAALAIRDGALLRPIVAHGVINLVITIAGLL